MAKGNPKPIINKKEIEIRTKFDEWAKYFMDEDNKETYRNATRSALKVYDTDKYYSAGVIGHENLKKLKNIAAIYAEGKGIGYLQMIDVALAKMAGSKNPDWWDRLMRLFGYADFLESKDPRVNVGIIFNRIQEDREKYGR